MSTRPKFTDSDFSLVIGGPLYRMLRRAHLDGSHHELVARRIGIAILVTWVPLLVLSLWEGTALRGSPVPFLRDVDTHVRFLLVIPLLFVAELVLHQRIGVAVQKFSERELIAQSQIPKAQAVFATAVRWLDSAWVEVAMIVLVYTVGVNGVWRHVSALEVATWYGVFENGARELSRAGMWLGWVSIPLLQFLLLRWGYRLLVWWRLMWQVSRMDLNIEPLHPDRAGGLGFLGILSLAFAPFLIAEGTFISGQIANQIFFAGASLPSFKIELFAVTVVAVFLILGPMMMFTPALARAKREGLGAYGTLGMRYVRHFDRKWLRRGTDPDDELIGSADIQSLADLGNSYATLNEMRVVPFGRSTVLVLAVAVLAPIAPLLLTMISLEDLLSQMLKLVS